MGYEADEGVVARSLRFTEVRLHAQSAAVRAGGSPWKRPVALFV